jgi:hypothetical protein
LKLQTLRNKAKKTKIRRKNNIKQLRKLKKSLTKEEPKVLKVQESKCESVKLCKSKVGPRGNLEPFL